LHELSNWKLNLLAGGIALLAFTAPAIAQIHVYIGGAPPPLRYEVRPAMPGEGYVWTEGYWGDRGGRYVWMPGVWVRPPYAGASWSHPHWDHEDHDTHHDYGHH
jgi:hypothetical protein